MPEIRRLHLARLTVSRQEWPVHGFVVTHPGGAMLVDTGVGGPEEVLSDWRVVNRSVAEALAEIDMTPGDIDTVVNTHLHFDHCGQNAVFRHAPCYVQRAELDRSRREEPEISDWFDFSNARWELLDGDADLAQGIKIMATPGHTVGHQSVLVSGGGSNGDDILIGDAAYTHVQYAGPPDEELPYGQAADPVAWRDSLARIQALQAQVHFCHDTAVMRG